MRLAVFAPATGAKPCMEILVSLRVSAPATGAKTAGCPRRRGAIAVKRVTGSGIGIYYRAMVVCARASLAAETAGE